jgi:predicted transposase/invertase (TIGR01784 family)
MSTQLANVHDAFFKQVLSNPQLADTFLREHLPRDVVDLLGPELPELMLGSFVDEKLRQHHSDLLFRVRLKTGCGAFAYMLMEHKSSPDQAARLQLLRYVVRILTDWYNQHERQLPLPPVLPLLAYQGPRGWTFSCEFTDLFGAVPEPLRPYLPAFRHAMVDFTQIEDDDLSVELRLRALLKALKYTRRPDLRECLDRVLAEWSALGDDDLSAVLTYIDKGAAKAIDHSTMRGALLRAVPDRAERMMGCLTQPFYEKGVAEGEASVLTRFLEKRFGVVPPLLRERIFAANLGQIDAWVERAFDAPDLHSIFDTN